MSNRFRTSRFPTIAAAAVLLLAAAPVSAQVILAEMLADPVTDWNGDGTSHYRSDEWVEVYNLGSTVADLAEYALRDALGDDPQMRLSGSLAPGEARVFYGSDAEAWQAANGLSTTGLSLNNGGDTVWLDHTDPVSGETSTVDYHIYVAHEGADDRAVGRLPDTGQWALFDALNPYSGDLEPRGTGCAPSPGTVNDCRPLVPAEPASWGAVKAVYR